MGLYKLCEHKGRARDRCHHAWWARFRYVRVSLSKWANREIENKTQADEAFDELKNAVRDGTFDHRGLERPPASTPLTLRQFVAIYKTRHVIAKRLSRAATVDYSFKPLLAYFGDRILANIKTADVEDFIAEPRKPRTAGRGRQPLHSDLLR